jgi:hypothetical protein
VITETDELVKGLSSIPDTDLALHRWAGAWDEFTNQPLHGLVLMDSRRRLLWHSMTEHAVNDVDFLVQEFSRVATLAVD